MNALASTTHFSIVAAPEKRWLVLECASHRTIALAAALVARGAWTPTWKVSRQLPRSPVRRKVTEACIPGVVFIPEATGFDLPIVPKIRYWRMRRADGSFSRIPDRQLEHLRSIAEKPLIPASKLPRPGTILMMPAGPWQGLRAKVVSCSQRKAFVDVETQGKGFSQRIQLPSCLLLGDNA